MGTADERPRTRHVEHCMGTVFTIDIRDPGSWTSEITEVVGWLHRVDRIFSTYRADSDVSRLRRGELTLNDADPLVVTVLDLCAELQQETAGYFTARWQGGIDPTGLVKGWAVEQASRLLRNSDSLNHAINGGGDMQLSGEAAPGVAWQVGIADPRNPAAILGVVKVRDAAVATSGTAERGVHVVDPFSRRPVDSVRSMTVVGATLTRVDAYATAAMAMGPAGITWLPGRVGFEGMLVPVDGEPQATTGWSLSPVRGRSDSAERPTLTETT